jgi:hypothetical protein
MKKQKPADVTVTDALRDWSVSKGWPMYLPDQFITEFHDRSEASGKTYANAEKAFQNQILWASPGHRFYSAQEWETKLQSAKRMERTPKRTSTMPARVAGITVDAQGFPCKEPMMAKTIGDIAKNNDVARQAIAAMRAKL